MGHAEFPRPITTYAIPGGSLWFLVRTKHGDGDAMLVMVMVLVLANYGLSSAEPIHFSANCTALVGGPPAPNVDVTIINKVSSPGA